MAAPKGNNYNTKYKTSEERKALCEAVCAHLEKGLSQDKFPMCDWDTVERYIKEFPNDFPTEKIKEAKQRGLSMIEELGIQGAKGEIPGFNTTAWIFLMKNKAGWKDRQDVTSNDQTINITVTRSSNES